MRSARVIAAVAGVLLLAACGDGTKDRAASSVEPTPSASATSPGLVSFDGEPVRVRARGTLIAERGVARICAGVLTSLPPQCGGGVVLAGLDATSVPGVETRNQTTWSEGEVLVVGTYDGSRLHVEQATPVPPRTPPPAPVYTPPCDEPPGGWTGGREEEIDRVMAPVTAYAQEHPETYAGVWWDGETGVPTVRFTGDLDAHRRALEAAMETDVCVIGARFTEREMGAVQTSLTQRLAAGPGKPMRMLSSGPDFVRNQVDLNVVALDDVVREEVARHPAGSVRVTTFLEPA